MQKEPMNEEVRVLRDDGVGYIMYIIRLGIE